MMLKNVYFLTFKGRVMVTVSMVVVDAMLLFPSLWQSNNTNTISELNHLLPAYFYSGFNLIDAINGKIHSD